MDLHILGNVSVEASPVNTVPIKNPHSTSASAQKPDGSDGLSDTGRVDMFFVLAGKSTIAVYYSYTATIQAPAYGPQSASTSAGDVQRLNNRGLI